jgi:hypothetical protein
MSSRRLNNVCLIAQSGAVFITESNCGIRVEIRPDLTIAMFLVNYKVEKKFSVRYQWTANISAPPSPSGMNEMIIMDMQYPKGVNFSPQPVVMFQTLKLNLQVIRVGRCVVITQGFGKVAKSNMLPADQNITRAFVITNSVLDTGRIISSTVVVDSKSKISS